jgi:isopropylmalate/homocitrate/citramalate synthase
MDLYRLSPYNDAGPQLSFAPKLNDCTLREGEQSSDASFSNRDRCRIATALAEAGVPRLQIGLQPDDPAASRELVRAAAPAETEVLILCFLADWREQIDRAVDAGVSHLNVICRASPVLLEQLGWSPAQLVETSVAAVSYGCDQGAYVSYSPGDTLRAEWPTLADAYRATAEAGASAVYVLDTVGVGSPHAVRSLVERVGAVVDIPIGIHAHNDLGLALANALAAYEGGARLIDTCVNGMGDRCGNPATDEVAIAAALLYHQDTGIALDELSALSSLVSELSGVDVPPSKPIVGTNAYAHKMDIHVKAMLADPLAFQPLRPELVGARSKIVVGKKSGPLTLAAKLAELGEPPLAADAIARALADVERYAETNRRSVPDDELRRIVAGARTT